MQKGFHAKNLFRESLFVKRLSIQKPHDEPKAFSKKPF